MAWPCCSITFPRGAAWRAALPHPIEAFFLRAGAPADAEAAVREWHRKFLQTFELDEVTSPLAVLHVQDWINPFQPL